MYIEESLIGHIIMTSAIFIIPWIAYKIVDSQKPKHKDILSSTIISLSIMPSIISVNLVRVTFNTVDY